MSRALPIDLERSIPLLVRREEPPPSGPPPQLVQRFILILALTAATAAGLLLSFDPDTARVAPVVLAYSVVALLGALCRQVPSAWLTRALTGLLMGSVVGMGLAALHQGWGLSAPALLLFGVAMAQPAAPLPPGWPALGWLLAVHLLCLAVGLAVGDVLARLLGQAVRDRRASCRERVCLAV